ncbi:MAG: AarF/ABC1/UbiB kinase family protein [Phycisphaerae bacterium]|jgi:predicted unusual protein kinase regulating ubiquinone biosynthesis (AarF/ABC1/UbiB family)
MSSTSPRIAELIDALPVETEETVRPGEALESLLTDLSQKRVPVGRWNRFWVLGTLQAKIALAYLAWWLRSGYASADKKQRTLNETHLKSALKLLGGMSYLRGAVMKVGQIIATHPEVAPEQFTDILGHLHFEAPPMHFSLLREFVRNELGEEPEEVFDQFETRAFAAASLGQVHRARLKGSDQLVAVKVQYPNIGRTIRDDFRNLMALLAPMRLSGDWDNIKAQFEDVAHMLDLETDYEKEAENLRTGRAAFTEDEGIVVPKVFPEHSTKRILTMEFIQGLHLDKFLSTDPAQELRNRFGHKMSVALFRVQYAKRLVYADPQPGNFIFMPDGRLGFIDFGSCYHQTDEDVGILADQESAYWTSSHELIRKSNARGADLSPKQAADERRMKMLEEFADWAWEPILYDGPFDFSDRKYFRRGAEMYGAFIKRRYTRSRPSNTWLLKSIYGLRAMLARLDARVDLGKVHRQETTVPRGDTA